MNSGITGTFRFTCRPGFALAKHPKHHLLVGSALMYTSVSNCMCVWPSSLVFPKMHPHVVVASFRHMMSDAARLCQFYKRACPGRAFGPVIYRGILRGAALVRQSTLSSQTLWCVLASCKLFMLPNRSLPSCSCYTFVHRAYLLQVGIQDVGRRSWLSIRSVRSGP